MVEHRPRPKHMDATQATPHRRNGDRPRGPEAGNGRSDHALTPADQAQLAMLGEIQNIRDLVTSVKATVNEIRDGGAKPSVFKEWYTTAEFGELPGVEKAEYTVREWCRLERINAERAESGPGEFGPFRISHEEYVRYTNHKLLPLKKNGIDRSNGIEQ